MYYSTSEITYGDIVEVSWLDAPNTKHIVCAYDVDEDFLITTLQVLSIHGTSSIEAEQVVAIHDNALISLQVQ